jgi:hypothetical protein
MGRIIMFFWCAFVLNGAVAFAVTSGNEFAFGRGYGLGPGAVFGGQGQNCGLWSGMGPGGMIGPDCVGCLGTQGGEECGKFLDSTVELRRKILNRRFDYFEAARNPRVAPVELEKLEKEIRGLEEQLQRAAPQRLKQEVR